jgi:hypothetical protein
MPVYEAQKAAISVHNFDGKGHEELEVLFGFVEVLHIFDDLFLKGFLR